MENENQQPNNQAPVQGPAPTSSGPNREALLVFGTYVLFFLPLVVEKIKNDQFFKFHMRQSLGLLIASVVAGIVGSFVYFIGGLLQLAVFVLWVMSLISALNGKEEPTPLLGEYFKKINI